MSSVVVKSADKKPVTDAVWSYAAWLHAGHRDVEKVICFNSWVSWLSTVGIDVDLWLSFSGYSKRMRSGIEGLFPGGVSVGTDLFPHAKDEFKPLRKRTHGWFEAMSSGIEIGEEQLKK